MPPSYDDASPVHEGTPTAQNGAMKSDIFESRDDGDTALKSKEGAEFRVHRVFLREASGLFDGMFRLESTSPDEAALKVLKVVREESAADISFILRCIYPLKTEQELPTIHSPDRIASILRVAKDWDCPRVFAIVKTNDLRIQAIAAQHKIDTVRVVTAEPLPAENIAASPADGAGPPAAFESVDAFESPASLFKHTTLNGVPPPDGAGLPAALGFDNAFEYATWLLKHAALKLVRGKPIPRRSPSSLLPPHSSLYEPGSGSLPRSWKHSADAQKKPFADGDLILHSRDGEDFYIHRRITAQASEWLSGIMDTHKGGAQDVQVIQVNDDAARINWVLEAIYPISNPAFLPTAQAVAEMLETAKYLRTPRALFILSSNLLELLPAEDPLFVWVCVLSS